MANTLTTKRHPLQVNEHTYQSVREMAAAGKTSMTKIVERAVEHYRHQLLLQAHNEGWSWLMETDPEAIAAFEAEDELWDRSTADGMNG